MAVDRFIVVREWHGIFAPSPALVRLPEGKVLDDNHYDIPTLQAAGVRMVPFTEGLAARIAGGDRRPGDAEASLFGDAGFTSMGFVVDVNTLIGPNDQDGTSLRPFSEINRAISLDVIPKAFDLATSQVVNTVLVKGGTYLENIEWDAQFRRIKLLYDGPVNIGAMQEFAWRPSGPTFDIRVFGDVLNLPAGDGIRSFVGIGPVSNPGDMRGGTMASMTGWRMNGQLKLDVFNSASGNFQLLLHGMEIFGTTGDSSGVSIDGTLGNVNGSLDAFGLNCHGAMNLGNDIRASTFKAVRMPSVDGESVSDWIDVECDGPLNMERSMTSSFGALRGFIDCSITGPITSVVANPAIIMDGVTFANSKGLRTVFPDDVVLELRDVGLQDLFIAGGSPTSGQEFEAYAGASGTAAAHGTSTSARLPKAVMFFKLAWSLATAAAGTELEIRINDTTIAKTVVLTGSVGELDLVGFLPAGMYLTVDSDVVSVRYNGTGAAPGAGVVRIIGA